MISPIVIAVLTLILTISEGFPNVNPEMKAKMDTFKTECAEQHKVSLEDVEQRKDLDASLSENMMCFDKCFFEKAGTLGNDGQIVDNVVIAMLTAGQPEKEVLIKSVLTTCKPLGEGKNTCEAVSKVLNCIGKAVMPPKP